MTTLRLALSLAAALSFASAASAAVVTFSGQDLDVGPGDALPVSGAAAASFDTAAGALGTLRRVDFETTSQVFANPLAAAPGVSISFTALDSITTHVRTDGSPLTGFNTTSGGSAFLRVAPDDSLPTLDVTISFLTPVQAFGFFVTGLSTAVGGDLTLQFNDGAAQSFAIPGGSDQQEDGAAAFFGFTDAGASIGAIVLHVEGVAPFSRDVFGLDDLVFVDAVPEPATLALLAAGLAVLALRRHAGSETRPAPFK